MSTTYISMAIRRLLAFALDWFLIVIWAAVLFGLVMMLTSGQPSPPGGPWQSQVLGFTSMTLPVLLYFSLFESSAWKASLGKRALQLQVVQADRAQAGFRDALLRNVIKFLPWEMGHIVANQAFFSAETGLAGWVYFPMLLSLLMPLWWLTSLFFRGYAPYDLLAGTAVVDNRPSAL